MPLFTLAAVFAAVIACAPQPDARTRALKIHNEAYALGREGRLDEAIVQYTHAIAIDPGIALIYHARGTAYRDTGDHDAAITDFNKALELDPDRSSTYLERGRAYFTVADFGAAEADLQRAIDVSNGDPDIFYPAQALLDSIRSGDAALDASQ